MSFLILWASPDLEGLTAEAKNTIRDGVIDAGATVEEIHLNHKKILSCNACGQYGYGRCSKEGICVLKDDFNEIYAAMVKAEAIIFVTPVYWHDISENFKALLDRMRRCETSHNGFLKNKRYISIACAGGYGSGAIDTLCRLEQICGHMGMKALDRISVVRYNRKYVMPMLKEAGRTFAETYNSFRFDDFDF